MTMKPKNVDLEIEQYEAVTEWCNDAAWQALSKDLPVGVLNRLMKTDRSVYATNVIAKMLVADALGKEDARDDDRVTYKGLNACEVDGLRLAMLELGDRAQEFLDEVRSGAHGCWRTLRIEA